MFAYPFYLFAACHALCAAFWLLSRESRRRSVLADGAFSRADGSTVMPAGESRFLGLEAGQESAFFLCYLRVAPAHGG